DDGSNVGALAGTDGFSLVVAVDDTTALAIAEALQSDSIEVVRATGAPAPELLTLPGPEDAGEDVDVEQATPPSATSPPATSAPQEQPTDTTGS
ncbi:MAG: hypothetical protein R3246_13680, partial [Acidimicrobiia bacterium]|nr:hypothetical protein [Acidimicrobiia bacterium]